MHAPIQSKNMHSALRMQSVQPHLRLELRQHRVGGVQCAEAKVGRLAARAEAGPCTAASTWFALQMRNDIAFVMSSWRHVHGAVLHAIQLQQQDACARTCRQLDVGSWVLQRRAGQGRRSGRASLEGNGAGVSRASWHTGRGIIRI